MSGAGKTRGLASVDPRLDVPREEIRFGVILNGGVSLAVWMGGAVLELDRLTKAHRDSATAYGTLLRLTGCTARADVIAGTSAGGINGAALALSQVNKRAQLSDLRDIWVDQGRIESLLRQPFRGAPTSLLRGDEFFLPQLNAALTRLAIPTEVRDPDAAPMDLTITTTVLRGNQLVTVDSMGQRLPQTLHAGRFHWRRLPTTRPDDDPFGDRMIERTAHRMALASRCTASFPVAFEPVFVPVGSPNHTEPSTIARLTEEQRLRPDMTDCVVDWGDGPGRDRSRFVVDGGLLANTPTRAALEAVQAMPAAGPVRRVMLLVYPHAPEPGADPPDTQAAAPTVAGTITGLLGALTAQGSRTFVDELEQHNLLAAGRRGTRGDVLRSVDSPDDLDRLTASLFPHFRRLRRWRAGRDVARQITELTATDRNNDIRLPDGWNYERIRRAAETTQINWDRRWGGSLSRGGRPGMPYVPDSPPSSKDPPVSGDGWGWGVDGALGVAEGAADLLRRLVWVLPAGDGYDAVKKARSAVSRLSWEIHEARKLTDRGWDESKIVASLEPNETYWGLRLASYDRLMVGTDDVDEIEQFVDAIAEYEGNREFERSRSVTDGAERKTVVADELARILVPSAQVPRSAGVVVRSKVEAVVRELATVIPILNSYCTSAPVDPASDERLAELQAWNAVLAANLPDIDHQVLLTRLLQLEVASTTLGDEVSTGAMLPVEIVQLSAQTQNAFTRYTHSGDDKLGGMSINRFGGFLKRSWRVNDWIWGRIDAASILCRTVLQPQRVRRTAVLSGYIGTHQDAEELARATVADLVESLLPSAAQTDPRMESLVLKAVAELTAAFDPDIPAGDLPAAMPALADLFAWALHLEVVPTELPVLAASVRADRVEGANARSRGELFLEEHDILLSRLESSVRGPEGQVSGKDRVGALNAFDRAGIGREPLREEASSDLTMRTATTAAAVIATVLDSGRSGLGAVRPVTRALRGGMLLPYWVVTGLTSRGALARGLALLGLSIGAVLLALSLFGVLPSGISGPAAALGASAVLVAFAYGALRSGTLLHGLVLLTPIVPLVAYAMNKAREDSSAGLSAAQGMSTLLVVLALSLALMLLGSLPASSGSVWGALDRLANRQGVPQPKQVPPSGALRGLGNAWRRVKGLGWATVDLVPAILVTAAVLLTAGWLVDEPWEGILDFLRHNAIWLGMLAAGFLVIGTFASWRLGRRLQVLRQSGADPQAAWTYQELAHPAGASAGWSVLYGALYLLLSGLLVWDPFSWQDTLWGRALLAMTLVFGVVLALVIPMLAPLLALFQIERDEMARAGNVAPFVLPDEDVADAADPAATARRAVAVDLASRGASYRWLVSDVDGLDKRAPSLTKRGVKLEKRISTTRAVATASAERLTASKSRSAR